MKIFLEFIEAEHAGDVRRYVDDVYNSGGRNIESEINDEAETCEINADIESLEEFKENFKKTDSYDFSNLSHWI